MRRQPNNSNRNNPNNGAYKPKRIQVSKSNKNNRRRIANRTSRAQKGQSFPLAKVYRTKTGTAYVKTNGDTVEITHSEPLRPITSLSANTFHLVDSYNLNPGLRDTFKWLSKLAANYETYDVVGISFEYNPTVPTTTAGSIYGFIDYDASDNPPTSSQDVLAMKGAVVSPVYADFKITTMNVNVNKFRNRYIRTTQVQEGDIKTYDFGKLFLYVEGAPTVGAKFGNIVSHYKFVLRTPQHNPEAGLVAERISAGINKTANHPLLIANGGSDIGSKLVELDSVTNPNKDILTFRETGYYQLDLYATAIAAVLANYDFTGSTVLNNLVVGLISGAGLGIVNTLYIAVTQPLQKLLLSLNANPSLSSATLTKITKEIFDKHLSEFPPLV